MWRQGDVFIARAPSIPKKATRRHGGTLVEGEITGHSHRLADLSAGHLLEHNGNLYLEVLARSATIVHEEHGPILLPRGTYRVWGQREYHPQEIRRVID